VYIIEFVEENPVLFVICGIVGVTAVISALVLCDMVIESKSKKE
jgi:hypothetical protein